MSYSHICPEMDHKWYHCNIHHPLGTTDTLAMSGLVCHARPAPSSDIHTTLLNSPQWRRKADRQYLLSSQNLSIDRPGQITMSIHQITVEVLLITWTWGSHFQRRSMLEDVAQPVQIPQGQPPYLPPRRSSDGSPHLPPHKKLWGRWDSPRSTPYVP